MQNLLIITLLFFASSIYASEADVKSVETLLKQAKLIFSDDFNRNEKNETKEELGKKWKTNSKKRAQGRKQVDLDNGVLIITKLEGVKAAVNVNHKAAFKNGIVKLKFNMLHERGAKFNFYDTNATKQSFSGHICQVKVAPNIFQLVDQIKGRFSRENPYKKLSKEDQKNVLAKTSKNIPVQYQINQWYELTMVITNDLFQVFIDGVKLGELTSEGIAHNMKDTFAFSITNSVKIDDLRIWSLD